MSVRSSRSAVGPSKRTSPFSMNTARSASRSAVFTDCSTRMIVVPWRWISRTISSSRSTMVGASPSESSSIMSSFGLAMNAWDSDSICCSPPDRAPAGVCRRSRKRGKISSTCSVASCTRCRSPRNSQPAARRFSATVRLGKTPRPPGTWAIPSPAVALASRWVMS